MLRRMDAIEQQDIHMDVAVLDPESDQQREEEIFETTFRAMKQHKDHPLRMKVLWDELYQAQDIKKAIEGVPELDSISDFMCVQWALVCGEDKTHAIHRAHALQDFRREYGIVDSYQEGCRALRRIVELCPEFLLWFGYDPDEGTYVSVRDFSKLEGIVSNPSHIKDFLVGMYYVTHACGPDLQTIQKGASVLIECQHMDWGKRHVMKMVRYRMAGELFSCYPTNGFPKFYNIGAAWRLCVKAAPNSEHFEFKKRFGSFEGGLASIYMVPDVATAQERMIQQLEEALKLRFDNEARFSLAHKDRFYVVPIEEDEMETLSEARGIL